MLKKLQKKFVAMAMLSITVVTIGILLIINVSSYVKKNEQLDFLLKLIADNNGKFPSYQKNFRPDILTEETEHSIRYFWIEIDEEGKITASNLEHIIAVNDENLGEIANKIEESGKDSAYYKNYKYLVVQKEEERLIVLIDATIYIREAKTLALYSCEVAGGVLVIVFALLSAISKRIIKHVIANLEQQKEFVTNAGHELKTPVAIILANAEVLEMKNGKDDEWVKSIKNQAKRLDVLIKRLLSLARMDEQKKKKEKCQEVNLSDMVKNLSNDFKVMSKNSEINTNIDDNIIVEAKNDEIYELVTILLDNAVKYVTAGGKINVDLCRKNKDTVLEISNSYENLDGTECNRLFERFYRGETSRSRELGGYGIGLSMAAAIVKNNNAKIDVKTDKDMIYFIVKFTH